MSSNTRVLDYFRQHCRGQIFSLIAAIGLIYLPFINGPIFFDDLRFFSVTVYHYINAPFDFSLRWFPYVGLTWTWEYFGETPLIHRLFNMLLHAGCTLLLFFWLRQITMLISTNAKESVVNWGAWLGALFFACHPVAVYAVGYLVQRSILLATFFTLAMQLAYLRGLVSERQSDQIFWLAFSVIFYFFAVFSKEHSLMAPAILIATTILLRSQMQAERKMLWLTWTGYLVIGVVVIMLAKGVFGIAYETDAADLFEQQSIAASPEALYLLSAFTQAGLFFKYLFLWIVPNPAWMSIDMRETFANSLGVWQNWLGALGFILYGALAAKLLIRRGWYGLAGLSLLYPWLFFMTEFSTVRVQESFVLYRSYLWLPGMMLFFPLLLNLLSINKKIVITIAIMILMLIPLSWNRLWTFSDSYRLWNDAALLLEDAQTSGAARIYYNRGNAELTAKKWSDAIEDYKRVEMINPEIKQVYKNAGAAYFGLRNYKEAIVNFDQAIALDANYADAYFGKGIALKRLHLNEEALIQIQKSCDLGHKAACFITALKR